MPMTMQETREAILAMLGDANGLEPHRYSPYTYTTEDYVAPGNYAEAESVEREDEGDTFYWVAYSFYEKDSYQDIWDLQTQLEQLFAENEWCIDSRGTIYREENNDLAHSVEYRFHTIGIERPASAEQPDFCLSCGWNTKHLKCNAEPDDHPVEECHYLCVNCGMNTGIVGACLRTITVNNEIKREVFLIDPRDVISDVSSEVKSAIGEILVGYALAENNLRAMMVNVPRKDPKSHLSGDIKRLKDYRKAIVDWASAQSTDGGQAMEECITAIVSAFDKLHAKRTALAHGQLIYVGLSSFTIGRQGADRDNERGSRLQIEHRGETVALTEDGIQEPLDNIRELQTQVGRLGWILAHIGPKRRF